MIGLNENLSGVPELSVSSLMRSLEQELAGKPGRPAREAQELVYDAWEAPTDERELELMTEALQIDPGNTDALLGILSFSSAAPDEQIELLQKIVAVAERRLGEKAFKEFAGTFWGFIETRPFMRAATARRCVLARGEAGTRNQGMGRDVEIKSERQPGNPLQPFTWVSCPRAP